MLKPAQDIHLYLRYNETTVGTASRAIDPLFRGNLLARYIQQQRKIGGQVLVGRTPEGFGYLLIAGWTQDLDLERIDNQLLQLRDTPGLIIDVRPNSGGSENLAMHVAQWFVSGDKVYAKHRNRVRAGRDGFGPIQERRITGNTPKNKRYDAPVAVLSSRYVMSSNEAFLLMMKQADGCTVIGQTSFGSSGNLKPHPLSNGVSLVLPSWQAMRPDGTVFESVGIAPDIEVVFDTAELKKRDPILERAIEFLKSKSKSK